FICQAFGIPAVGVGQPRHACVAYKSLDGWKVAYGRGWHVSRCQGLSGPEFVAGVAARSDMTRFMRVERLRWLASALTSKERAAAVMEVARKIVQAKPAAKTDLTASEKAEEAEADPGAYSKRSKPKAASRPATRPEAPIKVARGVIHIEAEAFAKMGGKVSYGNLQTAGVIVHDCYKGGKQVHFQSHMQNAWVDYAIDVPATGTYELEMRVAVANVDQVLDISSGGDKLVTVRIPISYGLWSTTPAVDIVLKRGPQTLRVSTGFQRGVALRWLELKLKRRNR
ncbi:MAG: carbohydrate-binding protein, partial [Planctomycetota bacterium]